MTADSEAKAIAEAHLAAEAAVASLAGFKSAMSDRQQRLVTIAENGLGVLEARVYIDLTNSTALLSSVFRQLEHDVRTPLMSALGAVEMLDDGDVGLLTDDAKTASTQALAALQELVDQVNLYLTELAKAEPLGSAEPMEGLE